MPMTETFKDEALPADSVSQRVIVPDHYLLRVREDGTFGNKEA